MEKYTIRFYVQDESEETKQYKEKFYRIEVEGNSPDEIEKAIAAMKQDDYYRIEQADKLVLLPSAWITRIEIYPPTREERTQ